MKFQTLTQAFGLAAVLSGVLVGAAPIEEVGISDVEARNVAGKKITALFGRQG